MVFLKKQLEEPVLRTFTTNVAIFKKQISGRRTQAANWGFCYSKKPLNREKSRERLIEK
jgi:hypothetical protein